MRPLICAPAHPSLLVAGDHLQQAAGTVLNQIDLLSAPPNNARSFLVLGLLPTVF